MVDLSVPRIAPVTSLRDRALEILRQAIVSGEIVPEKLYSATALAKDLGVSVSPVREAMLTLVNEGTLEAVRNRGFRIVELSTADLDEVFELRLLLEVPSMGALARSGLQDGHDELERLVRATEDSVDDAKEFLARDRDFHLFLLRHHGNARLVDTVSLLRDQTRLYGLGPVASAQLRREAAAEHRQLAEAILRGDAQTAQRLMTVHLQHIRNEWYAQPDTDAQEA